MLEINLDVPHRTFWTGPVRESREVFRFTDTTGRIRRPDHPHKLLKWPDGQLRFFEVTLMLAAPLILTRYIETGQRLALGDHILVDGAEYVIEVRPGWEPHLEPVP